MTIISCGAHDVLKLVKPGQGSDDILGDPVSEMFLFRIAGHIVEGKNSNGGHVGKG